MTEKTSIRFYNKPVRSRFDFETEIIYNYYITIKRKI